MPDPQPHGRVFYTGDYPALEGSFVSLVRDLRDADPLSPLIVIVTSRLLGIHLARFLAESGVPHMNIRFLTIEDLAERIAMPAIHREGRAQMPNFAPGMIMAETLRTVACSEGGFYFSGIVNRPGFHQAMLATIRDLEEAVLSPDDLEAVSENKDVSGSVHIRKIKDVARIWRAYRNLLDEMNWVDDYQTIRRAAADILESPFVRDASSVLVYGFYDLNALQTDFLESCFEIKDTVFFIPFEDGRPFEFAEPMLHWMRSRNFDEKQVVAGKADTGSPVLAHLRKHIFAQAAESPGHEDDVTFVSAPGEAREVREIARLITAAVAESTIRSDEVGVLLRDPESYSGITRDTLEHLGMNPYLPAGRPLSETRDGRIVLLLLQILTHNYARNKVVELMTFADLRAEIHCGRPTEPIPVHSWDAASVAAGIVEGGDEWVERLGKLMKDLGRLHGDDPSEKVRGYSRTLDVDDVSGLIDFMNDLTASLETVRNAKTWTEKTTSLLKTVRDLTEGTDTGGRVAEAVLRLADLDRLPSSPTQAEFQRAVNDLLEGETMRTGRFQRQGPAVVSLQAVRGIPFKMVVIPGMAEKAFPPVVRQDAILLDHERDVLNKALARYRAGPLHLKSVRRLEEERLLFRLAVGAAREKLILSFPRMAIGTAKERLPSSFILAAAEALTGRRVYFDTVENTKGFLRVPLAEVAVREPVMAVDEVEFDLSSTLRSIEESAPETILYMRRHSELFHEGLRLEATRWGEPFFTAYDGLLAGVEARSFLERDYAVVGRKVSPTRLEFYAGCPFAYLMSHIMGIEPLEEPERARTISPSDKGELVHSILWEFFSTLKEHSREPLRLERADLSLLRETATRRFREFEETGVVGYPMMWELEKEEILTYLGEFVEEESTRDEMHPAYFEIRYGMKIRTPQDSDVSTDVPVPFEMGGRKILLRGRIDRIDMSGDGRRVRVIDYKTGRAYAKPDDFQGGTTLQLPLYLHAAKHILRDRHPEIDELSAEYYHLAEQRKSKRHVEFSSDCLAAKHGELVTLLSTIADGIEEGLFFPLPSGDCRWCAFASVCGPYYRQLYERKRADPAAKPFLRIRGEIDQEQDALESDR